MTKVPALLSDDTKDKLSNLLPIYNEMAPHVAVHMIDAFTENMKPKHPDALFFVSVADELITATLQKEKTFESVEAAYDLIAVQSKLGGDKLTVRNHVISAVGADLELGTPKALYRSFGNVNLHDALSNLNPGVTSVLQDTLFDKMIALKTPEAVQHSDNMMERLYGNLFGSSTLPQSKKKQEERKLVDKADRIVVALKENGVDLSKGRYKALRITSLDLKS